MPTQFKKRSRRSNGTAKRVGARKKSTAVKAASARARARGRVSTALVRAGVGPSRIARAAGPMPGGALKRVIIGIKVRFELNTNNGLRRVFFGLEKNTQGENVIWKISFQLLEREKKTDKFGDPIVKLEIELDSALNKKAEEAAKNGLTPGQGAHAVGPAADDALAAEAGEIPQEEADATVEATLRKK